MVKWLAWLRQLVTLRLRQLLGVAVGALVLPGCSPSVEVTAEFKEQKIELATYNLWDLGVVDANTDQMLDIFTVNHSAKQSLSLNQGSMRFKDVFSQWGLDQDAGFPGLALIPEEPAPERPGLYINWRGIDLVIRSHRLPGAAATVRGTIDLLTPVHLKDSEGFRANIETLTLSSGATRTLIHFAGGSNGHFAFKPRQDAVPINFHLDQGPDLASIYVGANTVSPSAADFTIHMRDRHAMAWADYNGDMQMDVFIARGALSGALKITPLTLRDALYVQRDGRMTDIGESVLPDKGGCPARQAQWVDFDRDGRLDIFIVGGRRGFSSQLLRQTDDGTFIDVAKEVGLDLTSEGKFVWLDVDDDGYPDLVWVDDRGIYIYWNRDGHFQEQQLASFPKDHDEVTGLRVGDMDGDGHADVFVESPSDSRVLVSRGGTYVVFGAADLGLPVHSLAASWVDVDNDGILELYSVPDGIYKRTADGYYKATGAMRWNCGTLCPYELRDAIASWVDLNNDGTRDLVMAANLVTKKTRWAPWVSRFLGDSRSQIGPFGGHWVTKVFTNSNHQNHWLQVNLVGPPGNRQGLGARVSVRAGGVEQIQEVGHAEGSRYSQGHYRVYFGLGQRGQLDSLSVAWPDGTMQTIPDPRVDSLVTVNWVIAKPSENSI